MYTEMRKVHIIRNTYDLSCLTFFVSLWGFGLLPNMTGWILVPIAVLSLILTNRKNDFLGKYILLFILFLFVSTISCWYVRNQPIFETVKTITFLNCALFLTYYIYSAIKPSIKTLERMFLLFYWFFLFIYLITYLVYPTHIVPILAGEYTHRFRIIGQAINSLSFLMYLNKWMTARRNVYLLYLIPSILVFFVLAFRLMIIGVIISALIMYLKVMKFRLYSFLMVTFVSLVVGGGLTFTSIGQTSIDRMMNAQEEETFDNSNYIRMLELDYFLNDFHKNNLEKITGAGLPGTKSDYGKSMQIDAIVENNAETTGWVDWGLLGLSWIIGPITVLILLFIMCKCIYISWISDKCYFYIAAWFIFLLLISINNSEAYRQGTFSIYAAVLYLTNQLIRKKKRNHETIVC